LNIGEKRLAACLLDNIDIAVAWVAEPFSKWEGTSARQKNYSKFLVFELATVTPQALKYDVIKYTPYEFHHMELRYFRKNYNTMKTYR